MPLQEVLQRLVDDVHVLKVSYWLLANNLEMTSTISREELADKIQEHGRRNSEDDGLMDSFNKFADSIRMTGFHKRPQLYITAPGPENPAND